MAPDYGWGALFGVVQGALGFFTGIALARMLGAGDRGSLAAIQQWGTFLSTIGLFGVQDALLYFLSQDRRRTGPWWGAAMLLTLLTSAAFAMLGYVYLPILLGAHDEAVKALARQTLWWVCLYTPFHMMTLMSLRSAHQLFLWNTLRIGSSVVWFFVVAGAVAFGAARLPVLVWGHALVNVLLIVPMLFVARRSLHVRPSVDFSAWRPLLAFGFPLFLAGLPSLVVSSGRLAVFYLATLDPRAAGLFTVAINWGNIGIIFYNGLSGVIAPHVAGRRNRAEQCAVLCLCVRSAVAVALPLSVGLMLATPVVFPLLYGSDFSSAIPSAVLLAIASGVGAVRMVMREAWKGLGRPGMVLAGDALSVAIFAGGLLWLPRSDLVWMAAGAWFLEETLGAFFLAAGLRRNGVGWRELLVPRCEEIEAVWHSACGALVRRWPLKGPR